MVVGDCHKQCLQVITLSEEAKGVSLTQFSHNEVILICISSVFVYSTPVNVMPGEGWTDLGDSDTENNCVIVGYQNPTHS